MSFIPPQQIVQIKRSGLARDKKRLFELSEKYQMLEERLAEEYSRWEAALASEEEILTARSN